jgi:hypothetical protein
MKLTFPAFFLAAFLLGGMSLRAEDWTTIDGKVYPQVKVIKVEPDAVTILYRDGGALIPLIKLPEDLQAKFHYNASIAKAAADARERAEFENARALRAEYRQMVARQLAAVKAQESSADSTDTTGNSQPAYADPSHHAMGELVDSAHSLRDNASSDNHYSMDSLGMHGPLSARAADANHYSMGNLLGSGDPLNP